MSTGRSSDTRAARLEVLAQRRLVVHDLHRAAAEHVRRPHQHRIADPRRPPPTASSTLRRRAVRRLRESRARARSPRSAGGPRRCRSRRATCRGSRTPAASSRRVSLSGVCPPSCTITPIGCSRSHDLEHVLERERLEVQLVRDVEVGRDGLGIRVDHDRLVPLLAQRQRGAHAAVVELDALPDPIRAAAEDHDRLACRCAAPRSPRRSCRTGTASRTETRRRRCRPSCTPGGRRAPSGARAPRSRSRRAASASWRSEKPSRFMRRMRVARRRRRAPRTRARRRPAPASAHRNHGSIAVSSWISSTDSPRSSARFTWKIRSGVGWRSAPRSVSIVSSASRSSLQRAADRPARRARSRARAAPSGTLP